MVAIQKLYRTTDLIPDNACFFMDKTILQDYLWILRGKQRRAILKALSRPRTPTLLKEELSIKISNISDVLRAMEERRIVKCVNPKDRHGRLYELTTKGRMLMKELTS